MKLSEIKNMLSTIDSLSFVLPSGNFVPSHFHITEVGVITKNFIDCGGTVRIDQVVNFQLWYADDVEHKLHPKKLLDIITLSEKVLGIDDLEIEVEYQSETIGKYGLDFDGVKFLLLAKKADCLAKDKCGIPVSKPRIKLGDLKNSNSSCVPGGGCC